MKYILALVIFLGLSQASQAHYYERQYLRPDGLTAPYLPPPPPPPPPPIYYRSFRTHMIYINVYHAPIYVPVPYYTMQVIYY